MTKRREVDNILTKYTGRTGADLDIVKQELSEAGVVIQTDRESPNLWDGYTMDAYLLKLRMAGYVAVEPLIGEK